MEEMRLTEGTLLEEQFYDDFIWDSKTCTLYTDESEIRFTLDGEDNVIEEPTVKLKDFLLKYGYDSVDDVPWDKVEYDWETPTGLLCHTESTADYDALIFDGEDFSEEPNWIQSILDYIESKPSSDNAYTEDMAEEDMEDVRTRTWNYELF